MEPSVVLAAWAAGLAAGSALVIQWAVVGKGFTVSRWRSRFCSACRLLWLAAAWAAWVGCGLATVAVFTPIGGASCWLHPQRFPLGRRCPSGRTRAPGHRRPVSRRCHREMLLGHWYLVARLPRSALRRLCLSGLVGAVIDRVAAMVSGALPCGSGDTVTG